jgi:hypothetical protein
MLAFMLPSGLGRCRGLGIDGLGNEIYATRRFIFKPIEKGTWFRPFLWIIGDGGA